MLRVLLTLLLCTIAAADALATTDRFQALAVYLDTDEPVAAWQFELTDAAGLMRVVGVENGDSAEFGDAPYYDVGAVRRGTAERIVIADFSLSDPQQLPSGYTRIATVHVMLRGTNSPSYQLNLVTANRSDGRTIAATISLAVIDGA